jgi:DNA mismatch repair ATPase MutS
MSAFAVFSIVSVAFLGPQMGALLIFIAFVANGAIHAKLKNNIYGSVSSIGKLRELIIASKKLSEINEPLMSCYRDRLKNSAKLCAGIAKKTAAIGRIEGIDMLGDYVNILFLVQEISFFSVLDSIKKYREELKEMYLILGEIDALISVASYRDGLNAYVEPEFTQDRHGINIENMKHPLIESAVPNSMEISEGGIIITGSNMSGKSTFLRTFGVNALFSQTIITCLAESYRGSFLKVLTSISPSDNIMGGKSYYLGEAEALLRIIRSCEDNIPSLCIIDEIFRGTNPTERISAAAEILDYLSDHNALTVVATHDIELTDLVKNHYECYYFTEDVGEDGLIFDYKIRKGISNTRNAVKVLKFLGYPDEIVEMANKRAEHITNM